MNKPAEDFFASLPKEEESEPEFKIMEEPEKKEPEPGKEQEPEAREPEPGDEHIEERKKPLRSERRTEKQTQYLQQALQEEREARIRMEEQIKALSSSRKASIDPDIKKILLGEIKDPDEAAEVFNAILQRNGEVARQQALEDLRAVQAEGDEEVNAIHESIEDNIEAIEDRYGVDLTDDTKTRNAFLDFVESISPEDSDALPNMQNAWRLFQQTRKAAPSNTERKAQISSRGMTRSSQARPEGQNLESVSFDTLNKGTWWDKVIGK